MRNSVVTLVASDFLESQIIEELADKLPFGVSTIVLMGSGKIPSPLSWETIEKAVAQSDIVIVTAGNNTSAEECAAQRAMRHGKPLVLIALGYRTWNNSAFDPFREYVSLLFVADMDEVTAASESFPNATIVATGVPTDEEMAFPKRSRKEVRDMLDIADDEKFILIPGDKEVTCNIPLGVCVLEALRTLPNPEQYRVILTLHPGHRPIPGQQSTADLMQFYQGAFDAYPTKTRITVACKADPFGIGTPDMVPGADVVVSINSSELKRAAYLRIPAIAMLIAGGFNAGLPPTREISWKPCEQAAVLAIYDMSTRHMEEAIVTLSDPTSLSASLFRAMQEQHYPKPAKIGSAYEKMLIALKSKFA